MIYKIQADVAHTRRKTLTYVFDAHETLLWSGATLARAIEWCYEQGVTELLIITPNCVLHTAVHERAQVGTEHAIELLDLA